MQTLLNSVFSADAATSVNSYVERGVAGLRTMLTTEGARENRTSGFDPPEAPWMGPERRLNSYERSVLTAIYGEPSALVVLRGGAGSGKSSLIWYLARYVHQRAQATARPDILHPKAHFLRVDVQSLFARGDEPPSLDDLLLKFARLLEASICEGSNDEALGSALLRYFTSWKGSDGDAGTIVTLARSAAAHACNIPPESWASLSGRERASEVARAAQTLKPDENLALWTSMLGWIAQEYFSATGVEWPFVVAFDNIDPLPGEVVQCLSMALQQLSTALSVLPVKLVLTVRLSTFAVHCGALAICPFDHVAPDPVEVAFHRATMYFLEPKVFRRGAVPNASDEAALRSRLLSLVANLTDRGGNFARLLRGMCGSNVRNGLVFVAQWTAQVDGSAHAAANHTEMLLSILGKHFLEDLARSFARESRVRFEAYVAKAGWTSNDLLPAAETIEDALTQVLEDMKVVAEEYQSSKTIRAAMLHAAWKRVVAAADEDLRPSMSSDRSFPFVTMCAETLRTLERARQLSLSEDQVRLLAEDVVQRLLAPSSSEVDEGSTTVRKWVAIAISTALNGPRRSRDYDRVRSSELAQESSLLRRAVSNWDSHESRYDAERRLLGVAASAESTQPRVINVFTVDRQGIGPVPLHALWYLSCQPGHTCTRSELSNHLAAWSYNDEEITVALSEMVRVDKRLIFSGVKDQFDGLAVWKARPTERVSLSAAGRGYLRSLIPVPTYLQWSVNSVMETRIAAADELRVREADLERTVIQRLAAVRVGLKTIVRFEAERRDRLQESLQGRIGAAIVGAYEFGVLPTSQIVIRTLMPFLSVYGVLARTVSERSRSGVDSMQIIHDEVQAWIHLARSVVDAQSTNRRGVPGEWNTVLDEAVEEVRHL